MKTLLKHLILCTAIILTGCNSSDDTEGASQPPVTPPEATITANDAIHSVMAASRQFVSVSSYIESDSNGAALIEVTAKSSNVCQDISVKDNGFYVTLVQEGVCDLAYTVQSIPQANALVSQAQAELVLISSTNAQADFSPISIALVEGEQIAIELVAELGANFPANYTLSSTIPVLGSGQITADLANFIITYQSASAGLSRIVYTLEDVADSKMGYIDISVSEAGNQPPVTTKFKHSVMPSINQTIIVDLTAYVSDPDGDTIQLMEVMSYNATVLSANPSDITNKAFTFDATTVGLHYVSYLIADDRGGFSSNLVEIEVIDPNQLAKWVDITAGLSIFSAPLTQVEANSLAIQYSGTNTDGAYTPPIEMANMTLDEARNYCLSRGRLPTSTELANLALDETPSAKHNWPTESLYLADDAGNGMLVDLDIGATNPAIKGDYYVTCLSDGSLTIIPIDIEAIADGVDEAVFEVELRLNGQLVDGETLTATVTGNAILENSSVVTASGGKAQFKLTSLTPETVTVEIDYNSQQQVEQQIAFISVLDPIVVSSIVINKNRAESDGIDVNTITARVTNSITGNPEAGIEVDIYLLEELPTSDGSASGPSSLITDVNGYVTVNATNTEEEIVDIRVDYVTKDADPKNRYLDARTSFHIYNEVDPIEALGLTWSAPFTEQEATDIGHISDNNYEETGATGPNGMLVSRFSWANANYFCNSLNYLGLLDWRLPTEAELIALYQEAAATHPDTAVFEKYGWPTTYEFWSSDAGVTYYYKSVLLWDGTLTEVPDTYSRYVGCVHEP
jgi:hypothetical protein